MQTTNCTVIVGPGAADASWTKVVVVYSGTWVGRGGLWGDILVWVAIFEGRHSLQVLKGMEMKETPYWYWLARCVTFLDHQHILIGYLVWAIFPTPKFDNLESPGLDKADDRFDLTINLKQIPFT